MTDEWGRPKGRKAMDVLQEKWAMHIVHDLLERPRSFTELTYGGLINTTTLSQRLGRLEKFGLIKRHVISMVPPRTSYELTEAGRALGPVIEALQRWEVEHLDAVLDEEGLAVLYPGRPPVTCEPKKVEPGASVSNGVERGSRVTRVTSQKE